jgi:methyl-accepting chemotaxis protein
MTPIEFIINFVCYGGIIALALYDGYTYWTNGGRNHVSLKGEMTGLGILGTFSGIFVGLLYFDVKDIAGSVPPLLEGLKTAFGTSIAGLFFSIGLTIIEAVRPVAFRKTGDPVADTLVRVFQEFEPMMLDLRSASRDQTVATQAMRETMDQTMEKLAKGVTDEIIDALQGVISDFNNNLKEQFGENFKQLNEACLKLVEWQEKYIPLVDASTGAINGAILAFEHLKAQSDAMISTHQNLLVTLQSVGEDTRGLAGASEQMGRAIDELKTTLSRADLVIESLKGRIELTEGVFNHALDAVERKTQEVAVATHMRAEEVVEILKERIESSKSIFVQMLDGLETKAQDVANRVHRELDVFPRIGTAVEQAAEGAERAAASAALAAASASDASTTAGCTVDLTQKNLGVALTNLEKALVALTNDFGRVYREYLEGLRKLADK